MNVDGCRMVVHLDIFRASEVLDMDSGWIPWGKRDEGGYEDGEILDWKKTLAPEKDPGWGSWDQSHQMGRRDSSIPLNKVEPSGKDPGWGSWDQSHQIGQRDSSIPLNKVEPSEKDRRWGSWDQSHQIGQRDSSIPSTKVEPSGKDPGWGSWDQSHQIGRRDSSIPLNKVEPSEKDPGWGSWGHSHQIGQRDSSIPSTKVEPSEKDSGWGSWDQSHQIGQRDSSIPLNKVEPSGKDPGWGSWDQSHQIGRRDSSFPLNKVEPSGKDAGWNPWGKSNLDDQPDAAFSWKKVEASAQPVPYQWRGPDPWKKSGLDGEGVTTTPWSKVPACGTRWSSDDRSARCRSPLKRSARRRIPERRSARRSRSPEERSSRPTPERSSRRSRSPIQRLSRRSRSPDKTSSHRERSLGKRSSHRSRSSEKRSSRRSRSSEKRSSRRSRKRSSRRNKSSEKRSSRRNRSSENRSTRHSRSPAKRSSHRSRSLAKRSSRRSWSTEKRSSRSRSPERFSRWNPEKRSAYQSPEKGSAGSFNKDFHAGLTPRKRSFQGCQEGGASPSKKDEDYGVPEGSATRSGSRGRWMPWSEMDEEHFGGVKIPQEKGKDVSCAVVDESDKVQADLELSREKVEVSEDGNGLNPWEELFREGLAKRNVNGEKVDHSPPRNQASHSKTAEAQLGKHPPITSPGVNNGSNPLGKSFRDGQTDDAVPSQKLKVTGVLKKSVGFSMAPNVNRPTVICSGKDAAMINEISQAVLPSEKFGASKKSVPESATVPSQHVKPPAVMSKGKQVVLIPCEKSVPKKVQKKIPGTISPIFLKNRLNGPALKVGWKGSFEVLDFSEDCRLCEGFCAHPSANLSRKAHKTVKNMDGALQFKIHRRLTYWPKIFQNDIPDKNDIALYFYPGRIDSSRKEYSSLLKLIDKHDLMLRCSLEYVELLVFPSRHLTGDCQKWCDNYFMWGVFRSLKGKKASNKTRPAPGLPRPKVRGKKSEGLEQNMAQPIVKNI